MQVLDAVAKVRAEKGMMCALDGYPASGCGEPVKDAKVPGHEQSVSFAMPRSTTAGSAPATTTSQQAQDGGHTGLWTSLAVAVLVVLIAIAALVMGRRSRHA
jgi:cobalamin biosynthesis Mg chelatase CobN